MPVLRDGLYPDGLTSPIIIWGLLDGKAGHASQIHGLIQALEKLIPIETHLIDLRKISASFWSFISGRFPAPKGSPPPGLIIGAGHATHLPTLAARHQHGGKAIILMKPSLPAWLFDLCIIPQHDQIKESKQVMTSIGALNSIQPSSRKDPQLGLFLIGGESRHFIWDCDSILSQIETISAADPERKWIILTSRRTPDRFISKNQEPVNEQIRILTPAECPPQTFRDLLSRAEIVWVSPDSISMIYEALTTGAAVGLLELEQNRKTRASSGISMLSEQGWTTPFSIWEKTDVLHQPEKPLAEADRIAHKIVEKWHLKKD